MKTDALRITTARMYWDLSVQPTYRKNEISYQTKAYLISFILKKLMLRFKEMVKHDAFM